MYLISCKLFNNHKSSSTTICVKSVLNAINTNPIQFFISGDSRIDGKHIWLHIENMIEMLSLKHQYCKYYILHETYYVHKLYKIIKHEGL